MRAPTATSTFWLKSIRTHAFRYSILLALNTSSAMLPDLPCRQPCEVRWSHAWRSGLPTTSSRYSDMPPTLGDRLVHILDAIENIRAALAGRSLADFAGDPPRRIGGV